MCNPEYAKIPKQTRNDLNTEIPKFGENTPSFKSFRNYLADYRKF